MPRRTDIHKILIVGSGPIVIGQACEFDYSGTQACKALKASEVEITHVNLNDQTLEGFRHRSEPVFCVQYHPEAAPGPHDSHYLFDDFIKLMSENQ